MSDPIDIFYVLPNGVRWLESAESVERAKSRVAQLAKRSSGEYIVLDQKSGEKYVIKLDELPKSRRKHSSQAQKGAAPELNNQL